MSTQPQSHSQYPQRIGEQDCRDFLRTGRCKYGESCKYNHPPNVQSGGGIRLPLDPNEPPFPIRPNEPPCQYYLKHGTCKFGQTCKFHHPTHIMSTGGGALSGTVLMNIVGSSQGGSGQQLIALNDGAGVGELQQVVQLLPQRPGEPDCIYFLRNGRCKYGATCKYHHPLTNTGSSHQQRSQEHTYVQRGAVRDRSSSLGSAADRNGVVSMQYVQSHGGGQGSYGQRHGEPTHILVSDGSIRVMTISNQTSSGRQSSYQQGSNGNSPVITSSSVASSYETAASSLDYAATSSQGQFHQQDEVAVDSSGRIWRRATSQEHLSSMAGHRPHSHEHLSSLAGRRTISQERLPTMPGPQGAGNVGSSQGYESSAMPRHGSQGSFTGGRIGVDSAPSSESDSGAQQHRPMSSLRRAAAETSKSMGQQQQQQQQHQDGRSHTTSYGGVTYASAAHLDGGRSWSTSTSHHPNRGVYTQEYAKVPSGNYLSSSAPEFVLEEDHRERYTEDSSTTAERAGQEGRKETGQTRGQSGNTNEEGLSMMTSALLNMLDTTDHDAGGRDETDHMPSSSGASAGAPYQRSVSAPGTPIQSRASAPRSPLGFDEARRVDIGSPLSHDTPSRHRPRYQGSSSMPTHQEDFVPSFSSHSEDHEDDNPPMPRAGGSGGPSWQPTWQNSHPQELEHNAQSVSVLQSANNAPPSHASHGGGFYLP